LTDVKCRDAAPHVQRPPMFLSRSQNCRAGPQVHNIFADLAERGCKLSFSELVLDYGCDHQVSRALQEYGESIGLAPVGWSNRWCHASDNADVIHPWTGWVRNRVGIC